VTEPSPARTSVNQIELLQSSKQLSTTVT
jgi:hypothetical protein